MPSSNSYPDQTTLEYIISTSGQIFSLNPPKESPKNNYQQLFLDNITTLGVYIFDIKRVAENSFNYIESLLSLSEKESANQFVYPTDRRRYSFAHGILRLLISHFDGIQPQQVELEYAGNGKPIVKGNSLIKHFSLSKSGDFVAIALAKNLVGVDIEVIRPLTDLSYLVTTCFSSTEITLFPCPSHEDFLRIWTLKEATLKAEGVGLYGDMQAIEIDNDVFNLSKKNSCQKLLRRKRCTYFSCQLEGQLIISVALLNDSVTTNP